jgi:hypothetical protein
MRQDAIYVGIDISQAVLDVYLDSGVNCQVTNDEAGKVELMEHLRPCIPRSKPILTI